VFIFSDIVASSIFNKNLVPLLAVDGRNKKTSNQYVPLGVPRFSRINIELRNENNIRLPPLPDKVYISLHFREVR
jgi:hypothetical protein